jgi:SAM-dependent methyltransferase
MTARAVRVISVSIDRIREEFDRIALLTERDEVGGAGDVYHEYLVRHLPSRLEKALEVGCGTGAFTRLLASRAREVAALDLSPQMIRLAKAQSAGCENIEYLLGDLMQLALPAAEYDCIVSIATLHHLPLESALLKMKDALKPNGLLIIHDLVADAGLLDKSVSALAYPLSVMRRFWRTGRIRMSREVREAWAEHGKNEVYLTLSEVREMCGKHLPSAQVKRHLFWRYTLVWRKQVAA